MKRLIFIFFFLNILIASSYGQIYRISGIVLDSVSKEKLFYVNVGIISDDTLHTLVDNDYTNANGEFVLDNIQKGTYIFKASLVGYKMLSMSINVDGEKTDIELGNLLISSQSSVLKEVTIYEKKPVYMVDGEKTLYNVAEDPTIQTGTASDALQNAPGVEVDIEGNITLRGVSSVEIWINDKPSNLNTENLKTYIQQLPANSLEKIEVITNPSAKYSAKGTGGIINIVTNNSIKKNSFVSFGLRGSTTPNVSPWVSYVWANEKLSLSFYLNTSFFIWKTKSHSYSITLNDQKDTSNYSNYAGNDNNQQYNGGFYFNGGYSIDTMNSISFWAGCYPGWSRITSAEKQLRKEYIYNPTTYNYTTDIFGRGKYFGGYAGAYYEHKFNNEGHTIQANLGMNTWNNSNYSSFQRNYEIYNYLNRNKLDTNKSSNYNIDLSVDYTIPYHKNGEIGIGISSEYGYNSSITSSDTLLFESTDIFNLDSLRYQNTRGNDGEFDAYMTIQHKFKNFTVKAGIRSEYSHINYQILNAPIHNTSKGYLGFFPSLHLSYRTKSMHNFTLSYTRRVSNPRASQLTTFISYNEEDFSKGNPDLLQTFTNSVDASWTKYFNKFGSVGLSAYFKNSKNEIEDLQDVIYNDYFGRMVSFSMPVNAGKTYNTGADLSVNYRLKAFMNIRFYANVYYSNSQLMFRSSETPTIISNLGYSFRINFWAKIWKVLEVHTSARYRSKSQNLFMETRPNYSIDCGLRADLWKRKISLHLNVNDIFNWNKHSTNIVNPYYISYNSTTYNSRSISAGITFRFGKIELESRVSTQGAGNAETPPIGGL